MEKKEPKKTKETKEKKNQTKEKRKSNLIPLGERTDEERRAIGRLGGIAKGEKYKRIKTIRECLEVILSMRCVDEELKKKRVEAGLEADYTNQMAMVLSMWEKATKGQDVAAFNAIRDVVGEKVQQQNITFGKSEDDKLTAAFRELSKDL